MLPYPHLTLPSCPLIRWIKLISSFIFFNKSGVYFNELDSEVHIYEIKSFPSPPELVVMVMETICILLQAKDTSWKTAKALLADPKFLGRLINFEKNCILYAIIYFFKIESVLIYTAIPDVVLKKLKVYTDNPSFDPAIVAKVCCSSPH
jgi:Microtubule-binding stalk of dynein motor